MTNILLPEFFGSGKKTKINALKGTSLDRRDDRRYKLCAISSMHRRIFDRRPSQSRVY